MSLIDADYVKTKFPLWNKYFLDDNGDPDETVLTAEIANAEIEFGRYKTVTASTVEDEDKIDILNIVKYRGFVRRHGDTEFDSEPQIVKDYEETLARLKSGIGDDDSVQITAKTRRFKGDTGWFNNSDYDLTSTET